MPDPLDVLAEVLGEPAELMRNPANADYQCPFVNSQCIKFNRTLGVPAPVCSLFRRNRYENPRNIAPVCTCPNRFFQVDLVRDIVEHCWVGAPPANPHVVHEVGMQKFGKVDLVIADIGHDGSVGSFVPVELQAVDITGSVLPEYIAHTTGAEMTVDHTYNFNWANVRKRFISQLIAKGYYCHHWGTRMVAVVQQNLFEQFQAHARMSTVPMTESNIAFMLYQFRKSSDRWDLELREIVPTTHMSLMNAILYEKPPSRAAFERKILSRLGAVDR